MAGGQERILRRRIKSVAATRKITKAMELIAASQISKSQARIAQNRAYKEGMRHIVIEAVKSDPAGAKALLQLPEKVTSAAVLVITGDRGLSGAYNSGAMRAGERLIRDLQSKGVNVRLFTVGKKAPAYFKFRGFEITQSFAGFADNPTFKDARRVAGAIAEPFIDDEVEQVLMVSTNFISAASQQVATRQLLPLEVPEIVVDESAPKKLTGYTEFEPEVEQLLVELAPRALVSEIYAALLEGAASFHVSQQRAMAAATDNADELRQTLTRIMNRARQDSITTEIMEIVSGAEALRSGK